MKKKILGLDLGVGSIGWALIETEDNQPQQILGMGSRIVPISKDDNDQFSKGQAISKNADRTARRTARKGYNRYQMRRALLTQTLRIKDMLPPSSNLRIGWNSCKRNCAKHANCLRNNNPTIPPLPPAL